MPLLAGAVLLLAAAASAFALRWRVAARAERETAARLRVGASGIIPGAEAIELPRQGAPAVLLLHGGGDTPQTLRYMAEHLYERGYAVSAPLLRGHGRTLRDFSSVTADQWFDDVREQYRVLRTRHSWVGVIGLSMGGALGVRLAAELPDLHALVLLAPYIAMPSTIARAARLAPYWGLVCPYVRTKSELSVRDPQEAARSLGYGVFSAAALHALWVTVCRAREALPRVTAPTLFVQSREDNRIAAADAERAYEELGSADKRLVWLDGSGHVITVDFGREQVFQLAAEWLDAHRVAPPEARRA